ncbi:hypothetical protein LK07_02030 [Streptomyces pluripotens]|uniref:Secreted protein n=1 Tax=Streptomyces pluripotens TaxID=1355015 RepID=A0A221NSP5_9ACTN|nr:MULTISPECIES: hypothetical protein [Streptomyces]ARP68744.1 hypothetical protein LK06_000945 [Streptomyces pluripotens]ASN22999.1 hypothetical protein LK07_02030 [Streptomyces pluripotens]KIE27854.1 hypothetical protein LK08_06340 [Streptomyces sp. MUSC 125]MCH0558526.1 hypothetical protein [Streptomyces sp. MUM 16J]
MISKRRIVAALGLAAGVTGLAAPLANAADASAPDTGQINPVAVLDSLTVSDIPAQHKAQVPRVSEQMRALNQVSELNRLNELHQVTDLAAPVTGLLPAVQA